MFGKSGKGGAKGGYGGKGSKGKGASWAGAGGWSAAWSGGKAQGSYGKGSGKGKDHGGDEGGWGWEAQPWEDSAWAWGSVETDVAEGGVADKGKGKGKSRLVNRYAFPQASLRAYVDEVGSAMYSLGDDAYYLSNTNLQTHLTIENANTIRNPAVGFSCDAQSMAMGAQFLAETDGTVPGMQEICELLASDDGQQFLTDLKALDNNLPATAETDQNTKAALQRMKNFIDAHKNVFAQNLASLAVCTSRLYLFAMNGLELTTALGALKNWLSKVDPAVTAHPILQEAQTAQTNDKILQVIAACFQERRATQRQKGGKANNASAVLEALARPQVVVEGSGADASAIVATGAAPAKKDKKSKKKKDSSSSSSNTSSEEKAKKKKTRKADKEEARTTKKDAKKKKKRSKSSSASTDSEEEKNKKKKKRKQKDASSYSEASKKKARATAEAEEQKTKQAKALVAWNISDCQATVQQLANLQETQAPSARIREVLQTVPPSIVTAFGGSTAATSITSLSESSDVTAVDAAVKEALRILECVEATYALQGPGEPAAGKK